ncbi:MAG: hypothetical protein KF686_01930 [Ramlibacter sp.]|nr:hypothetical protein [Ramlibacter sp.]
MPAPPARPSAPLRRVINAWGTPTPYGVSRSDAIVAQAVADMLQRHVVVADLQAEAGLALARWAGAEAGCVTHCTAAAITLAVAACMAGHDPRRIAQLPDATGLPSRVPMLAAHQVDYGQPITQAIRLAGAQPVPCDNPEALGAALDQVPAACVLAVESHLAPGSGPDTTQALLAQARRAGVPLVLDAAAQDWRAPTLVASGADLVLLSGQKYLRSPTAGLVLGRAGLVQALQAQHAGIGRAMKPTKESLAGVLAALQQRAAESPDAWRARQQRKVQDLAAQLSGQHGVRLLREPDPLGGGFDRLWLDIDAGLAGCDANELARRLREGDPVVAVAPHRLARGQVGLELTAVADAELPELGRRLRQALSGT